MDRDDQFGPVVAVGFDGALGRAAGDRRHALPPLGPGAARRLIDGLSLRALLDTDANDPGAAVGTLAQAFSRFSGVAAALGEHLAEFHADGIIVTTNGCRVADACVVLRESAEGPESA